MPHPFDSEELQHAQMHASQDVVPHCHGANGDMLYNVHGVIIFHPEQSSGAYFTVEKALADKTIQHDWTIDMWVNFHMKKDSEHLFALLSLPVSWISSDGTRTDERFNVYYRPIDKSLFVRITHQWYPMYQHFLDTAIDDGWNHLTLAWTTQKLRQIKKNGLDVNLNGRAHANFGFPVNQYNAPVFFPRKGQHVFLGYTPEVGTTVSLAHEHERQDASEVLLEQSMLQSNGNGGATSCGGGGDKATPPDVRLRGAIRRGGDKKTSTSVEVFPFMGSLHTFRFYDDYLTFGDSNTIMCEYASPKNRDSHSEMMKQNHLFGFVADKGMSSLSPVNLSPVNAYVPHHTTRYNGVDDNNEDETNTVASNDSDASLSTPKHPTKYVSSLTVSQGVEVRKLDPKTKKVHHVLSTIASEKPIHPKPTRGQYKEHEKYQILHDTHHEPYTSPQRHQPPSEDQRKAYKTIQYKDSIWSTGILSILFIVLTILLFVIYRKEYNVAEMEVYELMQQGYTPNRIVAMTPRSTIY